MQLPLLKIAARCAMAALWAGAAFSGWAQDNYPSRPITMMVGTSTGGPTDLMARTLALRLGSALGQAVIVQNRDGANGLIASTSTAHAPPDGYTIQTGTTSISVLAPMFATTSAFHYSDLEPVALVAATPMVLFVNPEVPAKTAAELVALLKRSPNKYSYATSGTGSTANVSGELFKIRAGVDVLHVPYKGGAQLSQSVMAGETQIGFNTIGGVMQLHRAGKVRILMVLSDKRSALMPDIPTSAEAGIPGLVSMFNFYVMAHARTPAPIVERLNSAINKIVKDPAFRQEMLAAQIEPYEPSDANAARAAFSAEVKQWGEVVTAANIKTP